MADGDPPSPKLGDLLKIGKRHAVEADPMGEPEPQYRTTYLLKRPTFCWRVYRTQMGDKVRCAREVERLPNGLPTGRCAQCREEEMSLTEMRKQEAKRLELAEKNAKRLDGSKRRGGFDPSGGDE